MIFGEYIIMIIQVLIYFVVALFTVASTLKDRLLMKKEGEQ
tara:strand:+ start:9162 stop:9284 length:123 start_codon:yes stop_codon:yes gene_type:complete